MGKINLPKWDGEKASFRTWEQSMKDYLIFYRYFNREEYGLCMEDGVSPPEQLGYQVMILLREATMNGAGRAMLDLFPGICGMATLRLLREFVLDGTFQTKFEAMSAMFALRFSSGTMTDHLIRFATLSEVVRNLCPSWDSEFSVIALLSSVPAAYHEIVSTAFLTGTELTPQAIQGHLKRRFHALQLSGDAHWKPAGSTNVDTTTLSPTQLAAHVNQAVWQHGDEAHQVLLATVLEHQVNRVGPEISQLASPVLNTLMVSLMETVYCAHCGDKGHYANHCNYGEEDEPTPDRDNQSGGLQH
jgi:hypothetical protein